MHEEAITYLGAIAIGSPSVILALAHHDGFDGGTTLCLALIAIGLLGLLRLAAKRVRLPRAQSRPRAAAADRTP